MAHEDERNAASHPAPTGRTDDGHHAYGSHRPAVVPRPATPVLDSLGLTAGLEQQVIHQRSRLPAECPFHFV